MVYGSNFGVQKCSVGVDVFREGLESAKHLNTDASRKQVVHGLR
jgi:hypothetical protein